MKKTLLLIGCVWAGSLTAQTVVDPSESLVAPKPKFTVNKVADVVIDPQALTLSGRFGDAINGESFQQEILLTQNGYQYTSFYDHNRHVCVSRRRLRDNRIETVRLTDYVFVGYKDGNDVHNTISIGICPLDGTLHVSFDHHNDTLRYRRTRPGVVTDPERTAWTPDLFLPMDPVLDGQIRTLVCYPRFFNAPDGALQFAWRKGGSSRGDSYMADYDHETGVFKNARKIDSRMGAYTDELGTSESRNLYKNGYTYDRNGVLHVTGMWREHTGNANHGMVYLYSPDRGRTWMNNAGQVVGTADGKLMVGVNSEGLKPVEIGRRQSLINEQGQNVDSQGRIHTMMWHMEQPGEKIAWNLAASNYYHYFRRANGEWVRRMIPDVPVGSRPKIFFDKDDNAIAVFTVKNKKDARDKAFHFSHGTLVIAAATAAGEWDDWAVVHQDTGPFLGDTLADPGRLSAEGILSVYLQETPAKSSMPSPLRVIDFTVKQKK